MTIIDQHLLRVMPLHAVTELYGEAGLLDRLSLELDRIPEPHRATIADACAWAAELHAGQRRTREPYLNHVLRVTLRMLCHYRVTDPDVLTAGLLHDAVEDQSWAITELSGHGPPPVAEALAVIAGRYNGRVARLVEAVTMPARPEGADRIRHYTDHLAEVLSGEPWARVIKLSDFTDNGVGIIHSIGPVVARSARKYEAALPLLRDLLDRSDTPLPPDVKAHIRDQLDLARRRFTAILTTSSCPEGRSGSRVR
ncbi:HD domain-containing protein [Actinoplanes friuliensis]|uniref:Metal dependent phosphohydrolase n=1 Tax=Actinoplanes friuliensis DSM 7358 TaxID=1246995 RepID=U5VNY6_9ACTN|nr:HD domain-containing protein [Actinoplanes friuliensis]AGZ38504.1 metal dependent phosphohydrolase [Actinoplanes friuliensis DSM 7358]